MTVPMAAVLLVLLGQGMGVHTVGDTVVVSRPLSIPSGATVRPLPLVSDALRDPLGPPRVVSAEGGTVVEYPLVFWRPGDHDVTLPGIVLILATGRADTLPPITTRVTIASVLPARAPDDTVPAPQPPATVVPRATRSAQPFLILTSLALLLLLPLHLWWRRRGPPEPAPPVPPADVPGEVLRRWAEQGEPRAALIHWEARLAALPRPEGAEGPANGEARTLLGAIDAVRFAPADPAREEALCRQAETLVARATAEDG